MAHFIRGDRMRCQHCKAPIGELCRGEQTAVFCGDVDPQSPSYTPAYARILVRDDVVLTDVDRALMVARAEFDRDFAGVSGCGCG